MICSVASGICIQVKIPFAAHSGVYTGQVRLTCGPAVPASSARGLLTPWQFPLRCRGRGLVGGGLFFSLPKLVPHCLVAL